MRLVTKKVLERINLLLDNRMMTLLPLHPQDATTMEIY